MGAVVNDMLNPFQTALGSFWLCYSAHMIISKSNLFVVSGNRADAHFQVDKTIP